MTSEFQAAAADAARRQREMSALKAERDRAYKAMEALQGKLDLLSGLDATVADVPTWATPKPSKRGHRGIANLLLSDLHLDEVVNPAQVEGVNAYNRPIALARLRRTFDKAAIIARDFLSGVRYDGAHVWLNGDIFSGNIHEELKETNEAPIMASFDYWVDPVAAGLKMLAAEFGKLHVSVRVGNHGRNSRKPVMKNRVHDNFDWLFGRVLHRELRGTPGLTWDIPESPDGGVLTQYTTRFLATHGDQFRGGSGISGILTPLSLGNHRKSQRQAAVAQPYDFMLLGHFHQLMFLPRIIVNGALKGYDEYAYTSNFGFEVPQQAFWVTTPEHGVSFTCPIRPMQRDREGW